MAEQAQEQTSGQTSSQTSDPTNPPSTQQESDTLNQLQQIRGEAPELPVSPEQVAEMASTETTADAEAVASEPSGVTLDGKTFATEQEAFDYQKQKLETDKLLLEARQEGIDAVMAHIPVAAPTPPPVVVSEEEDTDAYYADPTGYTNKKLAAATAQIKAELTQKWQEEREDEQLWREFFTAHPDLTDLKTDCQMILNDPKHKEVIQALARKDKKKGMDYLAVHTRTKFQDYMDRVKPRKELDNNAGGPSQGNIGGGVTPARTVPTDEDSLDFATQLRNMRNM